MGGANSVDRPGTHLNPQANVHSDPIVRSSKSSLSGEVVAEEANTRMREVSSAPSIFWHESEQGDQLHQRAVRYSSSSSIKLNNNNNYNNFVIQTQGAQKLTITPE